MKKGLNSKKTKAKAKQQILVTGEPSSVNALINCNLATIFATSNVFITQDAYSQRSLWNYS